MKGKAMTEKMRAKMKVSKVVTGEGSERLTFNAVFKDGPYPADGLDEDNSFSKFTPQAELTMTIANPALLGGFAEGDTFYVAFIPA
jgi:hypothetical protein